MGPSEDSRDDADDNVKARHLRFVDDASKEGHLLSEMWEEIRSVFCKDSTRPMEVFQILVKLLWGVVLVVLDGNISLGVPVLGPVAGHFLHRQWGMFFVAVALVHLYSMVNWNHRVRWWMMVAGMWLWFVAATQFQVPNIHWAFKVGSFGLLFLADLWVLVRLSLTPKRLRQRPSYVSEATYKKLLVKSRG